MDEKLEEKLIDEKRKLRAILDYKEKHIELLTNIISKQIELINYLKNGSCFWEISSNDREYLISTTLMEERMIS